MCSGPYTVGAHRRDPGHPRDRPHSPDNGLVHTRDCVVICGSSYPFVPCCATIWVQGRGRLTDYSRGYPTEYHPARAVRAAVARPPVRREAGTGPRQGPGGPAEVRRLALCGRTDVEADHWDQQERLRARCDHEDSAVWGRRPYRLRSSQPGLSVWCSRFAGKRSCCSC